MTANKTVLVADDDPEIVRALTHRCEKKLGLDVKSASNGLEALMMVLRDPPDLLILDIVMPGADGLSVCEKLLQDEKFTPLPVIILTGSSDENTIRRCEAIGAHYVLKDPDMWDKLDPIIRELLRIQEKSPDTPDVAAAPSDPLAAVSSSPTVLAVDDDPDITRAIAIRLRSYGVETLQASSGMQGYWMALTAKPDVIITDYSMPEGCGDHMITRLKTDPLMRPIPIIVLTGWTVDGNKDFALERDMLGRRGVEAFLSKPLDFDVLLAELRRYIKLTVSGPDAVVG